MLAYVHVYALQGGTTVPKEVKFADREALFPWKPK